MRASLTPRTNSKNQLLVLPPHLVTMLFLPLVCPATDLHLSPVRALVEDVSAVSAGLDFTVWLCKGQVWSAGYPLYGQLGDGSDHMYNAKDSEWGAGAGRVVGVRGGDRDAGVCTGLPLQGTFSMANWGMVQITLQC